MTGADILVVEDAPEFAQLITAVLVAAGHRVRVATAVSDATRELTADPPDMVILDLVLPDGDGLDLCEFVRKHTAAYIIMVTGRADDADKLLGFRVGADDYLTKPFPPRELAARVEAVLRRPKPSRASPGGERQLGDLVVRHDAREVEIGQQFVDLTKIEFDLLDALTVDPGIVLSRRELLDRVWGPGWVGDDHVVDVHVANLRRKIDTPGEPSRIRTVRGIGYAMSA